ncbi:hypothetical protein GCM10022280_19000 [Sphingomonas swuensis]|uniref:Tyr recombinase domain-containing protein n=1 Tax=Sphingomonas swuensis TaxID=977800 RepID=A0ABP7T0U0_9SPHN
MAAKGGIYQRAGYWLDYDRGTDGVPRSPWLYICWYDPNKGRIRRKSTRQCNIQLACDALDEHFLAVHRPTAAQRAAYTLPEALTDYWLEHGCKVVSAEAIKARLKLVTRFVEHQIAAGRMADPILPAQVDDGFIRNFREWASADPIIALRKDAKGAWVESSRRLRSLSTVEESVIQLKAALNYAKKAKRTDHLPDFQHKTRDQVTPVRTDRLTVPDIARLLNFTVEGGGSYAGHAERLLPLRRYIIAAICTLARPDAIFDMSVLPSRVQWHTDADLFDLNPTGRIQTNKYRAVVPVTSLLRTWLEATDEWFVCGRRNVGSKAEPAWQEYKVASVRSGWETARQHLGLPDGWGPKLLRHSMATILANRRVPQTERKLLMGHEALEGSQKSYVIFDPDYLLKAKETIEEVIAELRNLSPAALAPPGAQQRSTIDASVSKSPTRRAIPLMPFWKAV